MPVPHYAGEGTKGPGDGGGAQDDLQGGRTDLGRGLRRRIEAQARRRRVRGGGPLRVRTAGRVKPFADGAGLCSPGRWAPEARNEEKSGLGAAMAGSVAKILLDKLDPKEVFAKLPRGPKDLRFKNVDQNKDREN